VPSQLPTIFVLYSASATGFAGVQDEMPKATPEAGLAAQSRSYVSWESFSY
jgi:hypothetical protein